MGPATIARSVIDANTRLSTATDGATIVDLGGGRRCVYHHALRPGLKLIAVDVDADELALNPHATATVVSDAAKALPLPDASVDLLVSRAVLEHVPDVEAAVRHITRVLKPGATTMHFLPGRYSLFAIAARALPFKRLLWLLHKVMPHTIDQVEFDVYYDHGWPQAIEGVFHDAGFHDIEIDVTWAQPGYFQAVYPMFLLHAAYEWVVRHLRIRRLAAYMIVRATH